MKPTPSQLDADIAESREQSAPELSKQQLQTLVGVTRTQLVEDMANGMSTADDIRDERF